MAFLLDEEMSSYQREYRRLFSRQEGIEHLYSSVLFGDLKTSHFRSVCWKIFLKVLPENRNEWMQITREWRNRYEKLLEEEEEDIVPSFLRELLYLMEKSIILSDGAISYNVDPRTEEVKDMSINHPLSTSVMSPWNKYFIDKQIRAEIQQDVVRTFPENEFFRSPEIQKIMINILFVCVKHHPVLEYKQGMHELLAPILFVLYNDIQSFLKISETDVVDIETRILLNQNYLEHDAYFMFYQLMDRIASWFVKDCNYFERVEEVPEVTDRPPAFPKESLPSTLCIIWISHCRQFDLELYTHLAKMEIVPQIYGIRWLRLLFGREFEMEDLLILWDAIFSDNVECDLCNYIFVAMLISIRELLLQGDYASCLNYLMRFPHVESVQFVIDLALHLREPEIYKRPESSTKPSNLLEIKESKERPESSKERPESSKERPGSSKERPGSSKERPESSKERPESSKERPESSKERPESSKKSPNPEMQESKPTARKGFYSSTGLGRAESLLKKNFGGHRPKSLSFTGGIRKLKTPNVARGSSMCARPQSSPGERQSKWISAEKIEADFYSQRPQTSPSLSERCSKWDQHSRASLSINERYPKWVTDDQYDAKISSAKPGASSTFPRTSIRNVMESKSHKYRASDLTQTHNKDSDKKCSGKAREMVPLFPPIPGAVPRTVTQIPLEIARKMQNLRSENGRMKKKIEFCVQELTCIVPKFHGILMSQKIKHEAELNNVLGRLEKVKCILDDLDSSRRNSLEDSLSNEASQLTLGRDVYSEHGNEESASSIAKQSSITGRKKSGSDSPVSFPDLLYRTED